MVRVASRDDVEMSTNRATGWAATLSAWTLLVWVGRVRNVLADDDLDGFDRTWRLGVAILFVVVAVGILIGLVLGLKNGRVRAATVNLTLGLAAIGSAWWGFRGTQILVGDWETSFKAVHSLLALGTVFLSVMAWRAGQAERRIG